MSHPVRPLLRRGTRATLVFASLLLAGARPVAPPTGQIEGWVRDQVGSPIANAQVFLVGTLIGAVADAFGRYLLPRVPVGMHTVRAALIGYRSKQVAEVAVRQDTTTRVDFILEESTKEVSEISPATRRPKAEQTTVTPDATVYR